jgi:hypothetical protein
MTFCLTQQTKDKFKEALKNGEINPEKLAQMISQERNAYLAKYVGKENAQAVNALFESKLLLKNQQRGMITWAKSISGITPQAKRDMISRIEKMDKILSPKDNDPFLQDLASTRLGIGITQEEGKQISNLSQKLTELKTKSNEAGVFSTETDRLKYGANKVALENYVNDLKLNAGKISFREQPFKKTFNLIGQIPGTMKSAVASFDNSFWGRQGIKTLLDVRTSGIWIKNFLKSWRDIGKQILAKGKIYKSGDDAVLDSIKADIYSRPNALNGKYDAGNYGLSVLSEEAYPSSLPEKIPLFGRLFKASEVAYNGGALRLRADLADRLIKIADKQGINTLNKTEAEGMGHLISSLTGRGSLGKAETLSKEINVLLFSVKFFKSNFDTLTAHMLDPKATTFVKKEAAKNLLSIVTSIASILTVAKFLNPNNVEEDPRSTNFGKIKVFGHWVDITGGMASLITLASRLVPSKHDGEWGIWNKSSTGKWTNLIAGAYGQQTALDVFENFWEGKLSPVAGLVRDLWKGSNFQGDKVTLKNSLQNLFVPISIQNYKQLKDDPQSSSLLGSMILDGLGFSTSTYVPKTNWEGSTGKELTEFKKKVGGEKYKQANDDFNRAYNAWYNQIIELDSYKSLSEEGKTKLITNAKSDIKKKILKGYGFEYKTPIKTNNSEDQQIKKLRPK